MARLTGRASEHHHEGPGDAPRRKRGRKSQTPSVDISTSGSKRPASPTPTGEATETKRAKRVQVEEDGELVHDEGDSVSLPQHGDTIHVASNVSETNVHRRGHGRRHSEPVVTAPDHEDTQSPESPPASQPPSGLTPHLNRLGNPRSRRVRMSMPAQLHVTPADETDGNRQVQFAPLSATIDSRQKRRLRRSHLSEEMNHIEEHHKEDKKLRQAFAELNRQLKERDQTIRDLEFRLEARRLGDIDISDDHAQELQEQLDQARTEIEELRASSLYNGDSREQSAFDAMSDIDEADENEPLQLVDPDDLGVSQEDMDIKPTPNGFYASRALEIPDSQVTFASLSQVSGTVEDSLCQDSPVPDKAFDRASQRFKAEVERLTAQLAESQGALRVVAVELQNLNVVPPGASSEQIITKLRHVFEILRADIDQFFPNTSKSLTNSEFVLKIPELFQGILEELKSKTALAATYRKSEHTLRTQFEGLLDVVSTAEQHNEHLQTKVSNLDHDNGEKQREIADLTERVTTLTQAADEQDKELAQKDVQLNALQDEVETKETDLGRLKEALDKYCADFENVTRTTIHLEQKHRDDISRIEQEHAQVVKGLEVEVGVEAEGREAAEAEVQQKSDYIDELESRVGTLETAVDTITEQLSDLRTRLATETDARVAIERAYEEAQNDNYELANKAENLEETLDDLQSQLTDLKTNLDAERNQREHTERELEQKNDQIENLESNTKTLSLQANELRSKLFQLQQEKDQAIADLNADADDREEELQTLLDTETQAREGADKEIVNLKDQIAQLEETIQRLENDIVNMNNEREHLVTERDEQVTSMNTRLIELEKKYAALKNNTNSTITSLQANITDLNNEVRQQAAEIARITAEASEREQDLQDQLTSKDDQIVGLEEDLEVSRQEKHALSQEIKSLSSRVEDEARELLNIVDSHDQEVKSLNQVITSQGQAIANLENAAKQRAEDYEAELQEKTQEIEELRIMGDARADAIVGLEAHIEDLKARFSAQEEDTRNTIDALTESQRKLQEQNEQLAVALKKRNADALKAVQEMKVQGVEFKTKGADLHKVAHGKVTKASERTRISKKGGKKKTSSKRQWDSGIGVDDMIEDDVDDVPAEVQVA